MRILVGLLACVLGTSTAFAAPLCGGASGCPTNSTCTAAGTPHPCCTGPGAGRCWGSTPASMAACERATPLSAAFDCYPECPADAPCDGCTSLNIEHPSCPCFSPPRADLNSACTAAGTPHACCTGLKAGTCAIKWLGFVDVDGDGCFEPLHGDDPDGGDTPVPLAELPATETPSGDDYGWWYSGGEWNGADGATETLDACVDCAGRHCSGDDAPCVSNSDCDSDPPAQTCKRDCCEGFCTSDADCGGNSARPGVCMTGSAAFCAKKTDMACTIGGTQCGNKGPCVLGHCSCDADGPASPVTGRKYVTYTKCLDVMTPTSRTGYPPGVASSLTLNEKNYIMRLKTDYGFTTPVTSKEEFTGVFPVLTDFEVTAGGTFRNQSFGGWKEHDRGTSLRIKANNVVLGHDYCPVYANNGTAKNVSLVFGEDNGSSSTTESHEQVFLWATGGCVIGGRKVAPDEHEVRTEQPSSGPQKIVMQAPNRVDFTSAANWKVKSGTVSQKGAVVLKSCEINPDGYTTESCVGATCETEATTSICTLSGMAQKYCVDTSTGTYTSTTCATTSVCEGTHGAGYVCDVRACTGAAGCPDATDTCSPKVCARGLDEIAGKVCMRDWTAEPQKYCLSGTTWGAACDSSGTCGGGTCVVRRCLDDAGCPASDNACLPSIPTACKCSDISPSCTPPSCCPVEQCSLD